MNLTTHTWIPTDAGAVPLAASLTSDEVTELHTGSALADAALLRLLALLTTRAGGHAASYLATHAARLHLHGSHPFLQVPASFTDALPPTPIHALTLTHATGRDITALGDTRDDRPSPVPPEEALLRLLTFHAFTPSRGLTRFNPSKDAPLARTMTFHAHAPTLPGTLALNAPAPAATPPTWERTPDWSDWITAAPHALDATTTHAWPWRTATLVERSGGLTHVKLASGPVPTLDTTRPSPDVHTHQELIPESDRKKRGRTYDQVRNPQTREAHSSLVRALHAALRRDDLAPLSFQRALQHGAARVTATGLGTRSGEPVIQTVLHAELPWPVIPHPAALAALDVALQHLDRLTSATRAALSKTGQGTIAHVQASPAPRAYWDDLWPTLSGVLAGDLPHSDLQDAAADHAERALHAALHGHHPGRHLGLHVLKQDPQAPA